MSRKVLIVDDDQIMLRALEKKLAKYKETFAMLMGKDGFEAVQLLKENFISLVVLDLKMPRMDGISLLAHVKDNYPDIPVIIISGYRTADLFSLAKKKGVIAYISKPFQVDDLAKVILDTLQKEAAGGTMNNVSPVVFLQLMEMEARSCTIRAVDKVSKRGGVLYFKDGSLIDARMNTTYGIDAAYIIFGWEDVTLFIQNECPAKENVINSDLQPIIMKAVEMKDDLDEMGGYTPEIEESPALLPDDDSSEMDDFPVSDSVIGNEPASKPEPVTKVTPPPQKPVKVSLVDKVKELLQREVGDKADLREIYEEDNLDDSVRTLRELESIFDFGRLKLTYVKSGIQVDQIILPAEKTVVLYVGSKGPRDKIIRVLSEKL
jgi:CheY-like chemotaxis protein